VGLAVEARGLCAGYDSDDVLRGLDLELRPGELLGVLGPNGSGKSTLVRALTGIVPLRQGHVAIDGRPLETYSRRELARTIAVVPQWRDELFHFTVFETVLMGRTPYLRRWQREGARDRAVVDDCLRAADATHLAGRFVTDLSGGEQQRVHIARALAQDTDILLLDEPTILLVSHDRYLIDALASQIWEMEPAASRLKVFSGTYSEYKIAQALSQQPAPEQAPTAPEPLPEPAAADAPARKALSRNQRQQIQKKLDALEARIRALESESALQEAQLANPPADPRKTALLAESYNKLRAELEPLLSEWEALATTLQEDAP